MRRLSLGFNEHYEEWDKPDFQMFAKLLYMGKIYEWQLLIFFIKKIYVLQNTIELIDGL